MARHGHRDGLTGQAWSDRQKQLADKLDRVPPQAAGGVAVSLGASVC